MPIKFTGNHICEKCFKSFKWNYFEKIRTRMSSASYVAETIPNVTMTHSFKANSEGGYNVAVNCPYCDYDNHFTFHEDDAEQIMKG